MKTLNTILQEKFIITKDTKTISKTKKLVDVKIGEPLYLMIKSKNGNHKIINGIRTQRNSPRKNDEITWGEYTNSFNQWTYVKDTHYDNESIIAGLRTEYMFYFIAADPEYFRGLHDKNLWKDLTDNIYTISIKMDRLLKEYIDEHIKF